MSLYSTSVIYSYPSSLTADHASPFTLHPLITHPSSLTTHTLHPSPFTHRDLATPSALQSWKPSPRLRRGASMTSGARLTPSSPRSVATSGRRCAAVSG